MHGNCVHSFGETLDDDDDFGFRAPAITWLYGAAEILKMRRPARRLPARVQISPSIKKELRPMLSTPLVTKFLYVEKNKKTME